MDIFGERTAPVLLSPPNNAATQTKTTTSTSTSSSSSFSSSSITASTFLPGSTSRGSRSRTRMATSMERNFYTFIFLSWALVILILSPSASANRCTPTFTLLSNGEEGGGGGGGFGMEEYENGSSSPTSPTVDDPFPSRSRVTIREQSSFKLNCSLNQFHTVKWMLNTVEITAQLKEKWDIEIEGTKREMDGYLFTELKVNNASQKYHAGEYRCTPQCLNNVPGANLGVTVSINIAINVTIADSKLGVDPNGVNIYRKYVAREKRVEITCKAPVPNAQMTWYRIKDDKRTEENMAEVCVGRDVELAARMKHPPDHCTVTMSSGAEKSSTMLAINRARKEGNETLKTISDFRRYVCRATKEGNQDGHAYLDLLETVSIERRFEKGERSVSAVEGNDLKIYCDIHGIDKKEFETGGTTLIWTKDGEPLQAKENLEKIGAIAMEERGKPYRSGFIYDMAEPDHRGQYTCEVIRPFAADAETTSNSTNKRVSFTYYVRIKDKLGALWPFLGICGEVVLLCTIILIYEKRRNKTELEESDTDANVDLME